MRHTNTLFLLPFMPQTRPPVVNWRQNHLQYPVKPPDRGKPADEPIYKLLKFKEFRSIGAGIA
jgi:hypothetical protein